MAIVDRRITSFELRQSTESKLKSSKLVESKSILKRGRKKYEKRYFLNIEYLNISCQSSVAVNSSKDSNSKKRKADKYLETTGVKTRKGCKGKNESFKYFENSNGIDQFEGNTGMIKSPIVTSQGYHLYTHLIIESKEERDVFTVGDHVMVCLSDGGERPAQITAFLYDPEENLQGVELRWFYSEHDLLDLGKIIDRSKLPDNLFTFEEEFLESDKCEVLETSVIKRMIRIWNSKKDYLKWTKDCLEIYSGPQKCDPKTITGKEESFVICNYHDERLMEYIKEFNDDLPSFSVEVSDNYLALYLVLTDTGTIVPISERRNLSYLLSRCSNYYGYYTNYLALKLSMSFGPLRSHVNENNLVLKNSSGNQIEEYPLNQASADLHWSKRPKKVLPCREKEHEEITHVLKTSILNEGGGVLFIAGLPGTGKTATVLNTLDMLEIEMNLSNKNESKISVCYINALHLSSPDHFYRTFLQKLNGANTWAPSKEACYSSLDKYLKAKGSPVTILVIDEIDWLQKNASSNSNLEGSNNSLLYTLFDWPFQKNTKLIIIAIANTMDLPEKLIPRCTSRCGYARINFTPFSVEDMITILNDRVKYFSVNLCEKAMETSNKVEEVRRTSPRIRNKSKNIVSENDFESIFCSKAIEFCARRIAQQSSDVRRALQVLHRAWEICKQEFEQKISSKGDRNSKNNRKFQVQIPHVQAACKEVLLNNVSINLIETLPLVYKVFLASLILELELKHRMKLKEKEDENEDFYEDDGFLNLDNDRVYENSVSLFKIEKRMFTILSLSGYVYMEYLDTSFIKIIIQKLVSSRIIQTFKGALISSSSSSEFEQENEIYYETLNIFGSDVWVSLLIDALVLKNYLVKNIPFKIQGFE
ncbi:ORC CDC6 like AAA+ ATPase [Cryptosporidium ubiquitum]|uniref:Origin recognition complex subunit 1 n=1 Tax=Cryptosporidium ubiquitum TaxID=857276 RepID=A0A1J4MEU3_9CRYT|nr:ORC CDC6 like AAA+ ATPase [Cryptosporidium ubiquitum]OII72729.1 ORC CDC6 like AAA+ ATPase [Cryptosporidium ubiquitum]